jgi:uncharacterized protein HemX
MPMQQRTSTTSSSSGTPVLAAVLVAAALAIGSAMTCGPAVHASRDRERIAEIDREDREVCSQLGVASSLSACVEALTKVRRRHEERLSRDPIL